MKNIIVNLATKSVVAICANETLAHQFAETYSYIQNKNAWYGLFQIQLMDASNFDDFINDQDVPMADREALLASADAVNSLADQLNKTAAYC